MGERNNCQMGIEYRRERERERTEYSVIKRDRIEQRVTERETGQSIM